ncbi:MAG: hypothetical protein H7122_15845 [Chitinophagaceae bacterium]|nr:hypothetical protein [Chitinophagaceae bacterium]
MKHLKGIFDNFLLKLLFIGTTPFFYLSGMAQDKKVEIDIGLNKEPVWYQQPWAWILGAAIFILLLVALLRGRKKE